MLDVRSFLVPSVLLVAGCSLSEADGTTVLDASTGGTSAAPETSAGGSSASGGTTAEPDAEEIVILPEELEQIEAPHFAVTNREDLSDRLPEGTTLEGVTQDPLTGKVYVLDPVAGIYLMSDSAAELVYAPGDITPEDGLLPLGNFSDLVALGRGRFALTSPNEGYIVDLTAGTMWRHFCYLPNITPGLSESETSLSVAYQQSGIEVWQSTGALAYEAATDRLWAQPITRRVDDDSLLGVEIAAFDLPTGEPQVWYGFTGVQVLAEAMSVSPSTFYLGVESTLLQIDRPTGEFFGGYDLAPEVSAITGLHALNEESFLLVDRTQLVLFTVDWSEPTTER